MAVPFVTKAVGLSELDLERRLRVASQRFLPVPVLPRELLHLPQVHSVLRRRPDHQQLLPRQLLREPLLRHEVVENLVVDHVGEPLEQVQRAAHLREDRPGREDVDPRHSHRKRLLHEQRVTPGQVAHEQHVREESRPVVEQLRPELEPREQDRLLRVDRLRREVERAEEEEDVDDEEYQRREPQAQEDYEREPGPVSHSKPPSPPTPTPPMPPTPSPPPEGRRAEYQQGPAVPELEECVQAHRRPPAVPGVLRRDPRRPRPPRRPVPRFPCAGPRGPPSPQESRLGGTHSPPGPPPAAPRPAPHPGVLAAQYVATAVAPKKEEVEEVQGAPSPRPSRSTAPPDDASAPG